MPRKEVERYRGATLRAIHLLQWCRAHHRIRDQLQVLVRLRLARQRAVVLWWLVLVSACEQAHTTHTHVEHQPGLVAGGAKGAHCIKVGARQSVRLRLVAFGHQKQVVVHDGKLAASCQRERGCGKGRTLFSSTWWWLRCTPGTSRAGSGSANGSAAALRVAAFFRARLVMRATRHVTWPASTDSTWASMGPSTATTCQVGRQREEAHSLTKTRCSSASRATPSTRRRERRIFRRQAFCFIRNWEGVPCRT